MSATVLTAVLAGIGAAHLEGQAVNQTKTVGRLVREDPRFDRLIAPGTPIEVLGEGFEWSEGPVWVPRDGGFLLFSDIPRNSIMKWQAGSGVTLFMKPSGYTGIAPYGAEPGSNGLTLDREGRLVLAEHGDRRIARLEWEGGKRTLADSYQDRRLNSPNDVVVKSNGDVYFTDPIYGLPKREHDPTRELDFCGVFRWSPKTGEVTLLTKELTRPNGLAFSPDERTLYVANSDPQRAIWMAYPVQDDGTLGPGKVFRDVTKMVSKEMPGLPDGLKVDAQGHLFATGPGGVHVMAPDGTLLGRIETGQATSNCAFGGDGSELFITADMYLLRVKTLTKGAGS
ncbi:MAG TPA: SMP-30/gluconolactonase/LRE family protein [Vicinamibacterales bacterium]